MAATLAVELPVYPHPSSTDSLWRGCRATLQTPPRQLVHTTALLLLLLGLHSAFQRPSEFPLLTFNLGCSLCCACSAVLCSASAACLAAESSFLLRERLRHWTWLVDFGHRIIELFSRHAVCNCHCFSETSEMCFPGPLLPGSVLRGNLCLHVTRVVDSRRSSSPSRQKSPPRSSSLQRYSLQVET